MAVPYMLSSSISSFWFFLSNSALKNLTVGPPGRTLSTCDWGWSGARWKYAGWFPRAGPHQPGIPSGGPELDGLLAILSQTRSSLGEKVVTKRTGHFWPRSMQPKNFVKVKKEKWRGKGRNKRNKEQKRKTQLQSDNTGFRSRFKILKLFLMFH